MSLIARVVGRLVMSGAFIVALALPLDAQVTETPVPFDSVGAVRSITPGVVTRLGLTPPTWPVRDEFVEARLFAVSTGGFVLVAERRDGRLDRYVMTSQDVDALRGVVSLAITRTGGLVAEEGATNISQPAGNSFVRSQMLLAAALYGPALSALTHDAQVGTAVYLIAVGSTFFLVTNLAKHTRITKAQNVLGTDGALRGTGLMLGALHVLGAEIDQDAGSIAVLVGGIGGSFIGYGLGRGLTPSEAEAMTLGSDLGALTAIGIGGLFHLDSDGRALTAMALTGGVAGYAAGLRYPRRAHYTVTRGDAQLLRLTGLLGVMTAAIPIASSADDVNPHLASALLTGGLIAGVVLGDRLLVRPVDHTESEALLVAVGAVAGGLMGAAIPVLSRSDDASHILSTVTLGAVVGAVAAERLVAPRTAIPRAGSSTGRLQLDLGALAMAGLRRPGVYPVFRLSF